MDNRASHSHGSASMNTAASRPGAFGDKSRGIDSMTGVIGDQTNVGFFGSSSAGSFMRQIKSAIDVKIGAASRRSSFSGVVKAPLLSWPHTNQTSEGRSVEYVLPSRRVADELMSVYWRKVHPLYPFLYPGTFQKAYESVWTGSMPTADERMIMCTLNVLFALACQLSDTLKPEDREDSARSYFRRAQELLQLDLWDVGSAELIQCLLLMGQYLQSTSSPHQCWSKFTTPPSNSIAHECTVIVGHAIRIAQGLGFHLPEASLKFRSKNERQFSRIIWHGCVLMDRYVRSASSTIFIVCADECRVLSMTFGRPAMISKSLADAVPLPETNDENSPDNTDQGLQPNNQPSRMAFFVESLRLYDIMNDVLLELYTRENNIKGRQDTASHRSDYDSVDLATILKLDRALMLWGQSLPPHLRISSPESAQNVTFQMQSIVCRAR